MSKLFITLQAKGGVGKSYVSSILAQYLQDANLSVHCIDTDTTNPTLRRYKPLNCQYLNLATDHVINPRAFDELVEIVSGAPTDRHFVVDVGSNGFQPFMAYAVENDLFAVLEDLGVDVIVNSVIAGGPDVDETLSSTMAVLEHTRVSTLIWLNAHLGALEFKHRPIQHLDLFDPFKSRILGWVTLPKYAATTFGQDIEHMLKERWTFNETLERLTLMPQMRIRKAKRDLWSQLDQVFFPLPQAPSVFDARANAQRDQRRSDRRLSADRRSATRSSAWDSVSIGRGQATPRQRHKRSLTTCRPS